MAKNIFGAAKVITTVSTEKVGKVDKLLGNGVVDQSLSYNTRGTHHEHWRLYTVVDYKKTDPLKEVPFGSVDFMIDSTHQALNYVSQSSVTDENNSTDHIRHPSFPKSKAK